MRQALAPVLMLALLAACSKPGERSAAAADTGSPGGAGTPAATSATGAAGGAASAEPVWAVVVLYNQPKDTAAFERYYRETHVPLVGANQQAIGFTRAVLMRFPRNLDGSAPKFYRKAELWFDSEDALKRGTATAEFKKVAGDIPNFATGGFTALAGQQTR
jgi:uncharacterized protein (TIGR02118 family)